VLYCNCKYKRDLKEFSKSKGIQIGYQRYKSLSVFTESHLYELTDKDGEISLVSRKIYDFPSQYHALSSVIVNHAPICAVNSNFEHLHRQVSFVLNFYEYNLENHNES
jgi:hypothetical protein